MPKFFVTEVFHKQLSGKSVKSLCKELLSESYQLREYDTEGLKWSEKNYPGGYTSFDSFSELHRFSSTFMTLRERIDKSVASYLRSLGLEGPALSMTDCWVNIMPAGVQHSMHIHPHSVVSGTFYVAVPRSARGIRFEDPRFTQFMARPTVKTSAPLERQPFVEIKPKAGELVLFESWLRHEVASGDYKGERVSISFNYA